MILLSQFHFQRIGQSTFQGAFPTGALVVKVGSTSGGFTAGIELDAVLGIADQTHQGALGKYQAATNTGALWNMLDSFRSSLNHLSFSNNAFYSQSQPSPPRLCFLRARVTSRSGS